MTEIKLNVPGTVITCGESKLVGTIREKLSGAYFLFDLGGILTPVVLDSRDWDLSYPTPTLPTEVGTVIESGGVRFILDVDMDWASTEEVLKEWRLKNDELLKYAEAHGGFTILLRGIDHKRRGEG